MSILFHLLLSILLCIFLYPHFGSNIFLILVGGVLVDIDHYFYAVFKLKKNIFDAFAFYDRATKKRDLKAIKGHMFIFHTIEFLIILIILSFYSTKIFIITIGYIPHFAIDMIYRKIAIKDIKLIPPSIIVWLRNKS